VAVRSRASRATAYRYFPTRSALVTAVVHTSPGSVRSFSSRKADGRERLHDLFSETFPRCCSMRRCATRPLWLRRARRPRADADRRPECCRRLRVTHRLGTRQRA
jgi:hypothetical protein